MSFTIWRATASEFALIACTLKEDRYISVAGIWGIRTKKMAENQHAVFEDETAQGGTDYYYMTEKGKNWNKFIAFCPQLKQFEFWDENMARIGTLEQEQCIHYAGLKNAPFNEQMLELDKAGLREVDVEAEKKRGTIFPPFYIGQNYLYGTCVLKLPIPDTIQVAFNNMAKEEAQ